MIGALMMLWNATPIPAEPINWLAVAGISAALLIGFDLFSRWAVPKRGR